MMCWGTGRERTVREYRELLEASGWALKATWLVAGGEIGVVEGVMAESVQEPLDGVGPAFDSRRTITGPSGVGGRSPR